ncbi:MAG: alpha/beta hydrolase fold domain-containing protein [Novosphingobium sp.]
MNYSTPPMSEGGILVPEHFVPTPKTISPQAQAFLAHTPSVAVPELPKSREDNEGWARFREASEQGILAITGIYADQYPAKVVTHELSASTLYEVEPENLAPENEHRAIIYIHGGGWVTGGGQAAILSGMQMAALSRTRVFSVDYRLVPEVAFPKPVEDSFEAYQFVLKRHAANAIGVFGASAGANLAPAMVLSARDQGTPLPAAVALHSCPSEVTLSGDSLHTNFMVDIVLKRLTPGALELGLYYANGHDPRDPILSPLYADFSRGFPPTILTSGTRDLLLSPTVLMHRALLRAGITAELHVWEAMTHAPFFNAPEEDQLYNEHVRFMLSHMA